MAAGFLKTDSARALRRRADHEAREPRGVVFQQYAIFPWLTVEKNIAFGLTLKSNRRSRADIAGRSAATST